MALLVEDPETGEIKVKADIEIQPEVRYMVLGKYGEEFEVDKLVFSHVPASYKRLVKA